MADEYDQLSTKQKVKVNTAVKPRAGQFRLIDLDDLPQGDPNKKYLIVTHKGKYLVTKVLGQGVFGQVFKGIDLGNKEKGELAIKLSNMIDSIESPLQDRMHALQMERETLTKQGDLTDVGSRKVDDKDTNYEQHLTIMTIGPEHTLENSLYEFKKGSDVNEMGQVQEVAQRKQLDPLDALLISTQLLDLMKKLQALGVIHTDLKPDNILWDPKTKRLMVVDFGENIHINLVHEYGDDENKKIRIGPNGGIVKRILINGKPFPLDGQSMPEDCQKTVIQLALPKGNSQYASPEANEYKQYSTKSDNYSLGLILAELFTDFNLPETKRAALKEHGFETKAEDVTKQALLKAAENPTNGRDIDKLRIEIYEDVIKSLTNDDLSQRGNLLDTSIELKKAAVKYLESKNSSDLKIPAKEYHQYLTHFKLSLLQSQISKLLQDNPNFLESNPALIEPLNKLNELIHVDPSKPYSSKELDEISSILRDFNIQYNIRSDTKLSSILKPLTEPVSSLLTDRYHELKELDEYIHDPALASAKSDLNMVSEWSWALYENDLNQNDKSKVILSNYILRAQSHIHDPSHPIHQKLDELKKAFKLPAPDQQTYENLNVEEENRTKRKRGFLTVRERKKKDVTPQSRDVQPDVDMFMEPSDPSSDQTQSMASSELSAQTESYSSDLSDDAYEAGEIDIPVDFEGKRSEISKQIHRKELRDEHKIKQGGSWVPPKKRD